MIQVSPAMAGPSAFRLLHNELVRDHPLFPGPILHGQVQCACGKTPYFVVAVDDEVALRSTGFWKEFWHHLYEHEEQECADEGRMFVPDTEWEARYATA